MKYQAQAILSLMLGFLLIGPLVCRADDQPGRPALMAGVGTTDITPGPIGPMCGYGDRKGKPSTGVHDRLKCRSLFLGNGELGICVVSCDMLVITPELREAVLARVASSGIDYVMISATHTHSGPGGYKEGWAIEKFLMGSYSEAMFDFLADRIAEAVLASSATTVSATVGFSSGEAPGLVRNRRHDDGPTDAQVGVLRLDGPDGGLLALVVNFSAHPTVLSPRNLEYSGDYAGLAASRIEKETGAAVLFLLGANGDQKPHYEGYSDWDEPLDRQMEQATRIAEALSTKVIGVADSIRTSSCRELDMAQLEVKLPPVNLKASCFKYALVPVARLLFRGLFYDTALFQALRIDDLVIAAVPAELNGTLGIRLKEELGQGRTMIVGLANGSVGYVLEEADYRTGGYEVCASFYGPAFDRFIRSNTIDAAASLAAIH